MVLNVCEVAACVHASETLSLKKQVGCFNHGVGTLVASKLKRQRLWEVYCIRDYNHKATKETAALIMHLTMLILHADSDH